MVNESGNRHQLNHILGVDGNPQKALTWFGDGEKELKEEKQRGFYDEEKDYMDFEEDEEHISRGSDRKRIKVMQVDFKKEGAGGRNARNSQDVRESELQCITDFDFIYDCPMIREFGEKNFMRVNFGKNVPNVTVKRVLNKGLLCEDPFNTKLKTCLYRFCAHSPSQLRNRSCIFVNFDADFWSEKFPDLERLKQMKKRSEKHKLIKPTYIYDHFGKFDQKVVAKYAARVGLLLSPTAQYVFVPDDKWGREPDLKTGELEFTDGCGRMSTKIAKMFLDQMGNYAKERYSHQEYGVPSVIQFRMMGCKGILMHDPTLDKPSEKDVMLRDSQWKFDWNMKTRKTRETGKADGQTVVGRALGKCARGESRPFQFGRLNKQYVLMLSALGIKREVFLDIQEEHFDRLRRCLDDRKQAFEILCGNGKMDEADELLQLHDEDPLPKSVVTQLKRFRKPVTEMPINPGYDKQEDKDTENSAFYIPIRKSRNIYGVADISRKLKVRECFVQVTEHGDGFCSSYRRARPRMKVTKIPDGTRIVVVKCPTYYPGDIRILTQRNVPELSHLVDVIVFPTDPSMKRPHPHEIHESDLDGDEYFVCWDEKLVPEKEQKPMATVIKEKVEKKADAVQISDVIEAFATNDAIMGQVNNTFMKWADHSPYGANSKECKELAKIFAQSVDGAKHGGAAHIPPNLSAKDIVTEDKPDLVQHNMLAEVKKQPYRSAYDKLVRYEGLNCRFRPTPKNATYFLADMERTSDDQNCSDFFAMVKYGIFATRNEELLKKLNTTNNGPSLTFGQSTIIIAFERHRKDDETRVMKLVGMCQIKSKWQPFEWQESPFSFSHHGAYVAKWLFCREFVAPSCLYIPSSRGLLHISALIDGDSVDTTAGNKIFNIFARQPCAENLHYQPGPTDALINEDFGRKRWALEEEKLQRHVRQMRNKYQPQQKTELKTRKPKN